MNSLEQQSQKPAATTTKWRGFRARNPTVPNTALEVGRKRIWGLMASQAVREAVHAQEHRTPSTIDGISKRFLWDGRLAIDFQLAGAVRSCVILIFPAAT
ncbi:hypothetical protein Cob_v009356 [Colletotrichum orbiculare MAFF 240422]|uniref:Uncharacterized protein n=1 Tax=Colletotrichum orbiculare (strain 104-T / ATCC 96160 / CBS 514.97 / LARS 414 / MAFF 240422) TaxID=1213857 RepID=A0A484FJ69_COLOR|nr:hypothetical protein Cob_v009356 [Colletotrichum orbiculare MAFF 240422]